MENPYQSPEEPSVAGWGPNQRPQGLVGHIRVLAILMIVQGSFEVLMALLYGTMAVVMGSVMSQPGMQQQQGGPPPEQFFWITLVMYGAFAIAALIAAILHIVAGIKNYRFRGRVLGIVALAGGALTLFTCWCLPTAIGLGVYGLIVYLNGPVTEAFRMGEDGCSPDKILSAF
jgi:hypothetical protein